MVQDIRLVWRRFLFAPAHTVLLILILGLGIGATTAVYTVVDQTVLRPAPFAHADRLVNVIDFSRTSGGGGSSLTPPKILGWRAQRALFEAFEAFAPRTMDATGDAEPERIQGLVVSLGLFDMLGVQPRLGRGFARGDGVPGGERIVIVSESLWQRRLGGRDDVLGTTIALNDEPYTIVGVMPRRFRLTGDKESFWLPFDLAANAGDATARWFFGLGRLSPGVVRGTEQRLADSIADQLQAQAPLDRTWDLRLEPKKVAYVADATRNALFVLLGAVGFVLLITCANTASLFLSQLAVRQREMAIRTAIGAGRGRLLRQVLTESVLLAGCGGVAGLLFAAWGVDAIVAAAPANLAFQATSPIEIDRRIVAVAGAMTLATGIGFGLVPAFRGSRTALDGILKGTAVAGGRGAYTRFAGGLVVAEVAFSMILLVGAVLMMRTFANLAAIDPGFDPKELVAVDVSLPTDKYPSGGARAAFAATVEERLRALPGVSDVAISAPAAYHFGTPDAEGSDPAVAPRELVLPALTVSPDYFRTMRLPIVAGRTFTHADGTNAVVISRALAARFWPDGSAVGRRFRAYSRLDWQTVVGVAGDVAGPIGDENRTPLMLYSTWPAPSAAAAPAPAAPRTRAYSTRRIIVRARDARAAVPAITAALWSVDRNQPIDRVALVEDLHADAFARQRFVLQLMAVFALVAIVLTAAGIFGVLSEIVARKTREIGIRIALGARPADVLRLVLTRGLTFTIVGTALGIGGALALTRFLEALLFGVRPADPLSFVTGAAVVTAIALLACWVPARRAMHVGPAEALRMD